MGLPGGEGCREVPPAVGGELEAGRGAWARGGGPGLRGSLEGPGAEPASSGLWGGAADGNVHGSSRLLNCNRGVLDSQRRRVERARRT